MLIQLLFATLAFAASNFYLGSWKIVSAVTAPWSDKTLPPYPDEVKALVGKTMRILPGEMIGPGLLACKGPHYLVKDYPADMLFEGAFGEMQSKDKSVDPGTVAAKVGFHGTSWKTLETGCSNELNYHFPDAGTAEFALNNSIYILKKQ